MNNKLRSWIKKFVKPHVVHVGLDQSHHFAGLQKELALTRILAAQSLIQQLKSCPAERGLRNTEFKVFSQFGDDGIIQYLIHRADIRAENHSFVEFGVENYLESNTRFLLLNDNWRGLVMDGGQSYMDFVRDDEISWRHDLTSAAHFIDAENINGLLTQHGFTGEIGLLSVDIDGNDYWVWKAITAVSPVIVVVEYNSVFGPDHAVTIPYDPTFRRTAAHHSNLYWGVSVRALAQLAAEKGYAFVGCNSAGNNAYFVRKDRLGDVIPISVEEGYVESRFRESRDENYKLTHVSGPKRVELIREMSVFDVVRQRKVRLAELMEAPARPTSDTKMRAA